MTHRGPFQPRTFCGSVKVWFVLLLSAARLILGGARGVWWELSGMWSAGSFGQLLGAAESFSWEERWEQLTIPPASLEVTLSPLGYYFVLLLLLSSSKPCRPPLGQAALTLLNPGASLGG